MKRMSFEEAYEQIPGNGWLSKEEARLLWKYATSVTGPILEVGCYKGRSTVLLALSNPQRQVYTVDPFSSFDSSDPTGSDAWGGISNESKGKKH